MKLIVALAMGLFSGVLIYFMAAMLLTDLGDQEAPSSIFVFVTLLGGWAGSTYLLVKNARTTAKVFSRGFLLGAAEWMAMVFVGLVFSGRAVGATVSSSSSGAESAGAAIGGGVMAILTGGLSIGMAILCLIGFAISYSMGKEMRAEAAAATKKCPECAELVQEDAKRCRYCGVELTSVRAGT